MKYVAGFLILFIMLLVTLAEGVVQGKGAQETTDLQVAESGLLERIDFGNAFIMGQTIKSGAVYLLKRKKARSKACSKAEKVIEKKLWKISPLRNLKERTVRSKQMATGQMSISGSSPHINLRETRWNGNDA